MLSLNILINNEQQRFFQSSASNFTMKNLANFHAISFNNFYNNYRGDLNNHAALQTFKKCIKNLQKS